VKAAVTSAGLVKKTPSATKTEPMMARFLGMDVDGFLAMGWFLGMDVGMGSLLWVGCYGWGWVPCYGLVAMDVDGFLAMGWLLDMGGCPAMGSWIYGHTRRREAEAGQRAAPYLPWVAGCVMCGVWSHAVEGARRREVLGDSCGELEQLRPWLRSQCPGPTLGVPSCTGPRGAPGGGAGAVLGRHAT